MGRGYARLIPLRMTHSDGFLQVQEYQALWEYVSFQLSLLALQCCHPKIFLAHWQQQELDRQFHSPFSTGHVQHFHRHQGQIHIQSGPPWLTARLVCLKDNSTDAIIKRRKHVEMFLFAKIAFFNEKSFVFQKKQSICVCSYCIAEILSIKYTIKIIIRHTTKRLICLVCN